MNLRRCLNVGCGLSKNPLVGLGSKRGRGENLDGEIPTLARKQKHTVTVMFVSMSLILILAVGISAVVIIGMQGAGKQKAPAVAHRFAEAARHMNGDAEPPRALVNLVNQAQTRR